MNAHAVGIEEFTQLSVEFELPPCTFFSYPDTIPIVYMPVELVKGTK